MTVELILTIFISFFIGAIITWFIVKNRLSIKMADLANKLFNAEQKNAEIEAIVAKLSTANETLNEENVSFEKDITRLTTEHLLTAKALDEKLADLKSLNEKLDSLQKENSIGLLQKTVAEQNLENALEANTQLKQTIVSLQEEIKKLSQELSHTERSAAISATELAENVKRLKEQQEFIDGAEKNLNNAFQALSAEALKNNNISFITLANAKLDEKLAESKGVFEKKEQAIDALVKPLSESLSKFDSKIQELEKVRLEQHGQVNQYILGVQQTTDKLQKETHNLVSALKTSHVRGRYGEVALRRVVEFAGMTEHCDFREQASVQTEEGMLRPDMNILLPESKTIVVDSKVPLAAYMRAFETEDENERRNYLLQHAVAVKEHLKKLSAKAYWSQFGDSPDYVILYMQIESSFGAALQSDPSLLEEGIRNKIVFATPTTLITLLKTVSFVWQQRSVANNIESIRDAAIELYNRTTVLLNHFGKMGSSLKTTVNHYNSAVSSLQTRFIPQASKLYTMGSAYTKNIIPQIEQIDIAPRLVDNTEPSATLTDEEKVAASLRLEE
jgi:DNA recombination protein RmuC